MAFSYNSGFQTGVSTTCVGGRADNKKIEDTVDKYVYDQMHERLKTPYARRMKKPLQTTVEPVLGTLINFMVIGRIWTRGLKNANKFMIGTAFAYNLKKWLNYIEQKRKKAVISLPTCRNKLKKIEESLYYLLLAEQCFVKRYSTKSAYQLTEIK